jgi:hypothetical protein
VRESLPLTIASIKESKKIEESKHRQQTIVDLPKDSPGLLIGVLWDINGRSLEFEMLGISLRVLLQGVAYDGLLLHLRDVGLAGNIHDGKEVDDGDGFNEKSGHGR